VLCSAASKPSNGLLQYWLSLVILSIMYPLVGVRINLIEDRFPVFCPQGERFA